MGARVRTSKTGIGLLLLLAFVAGALFHRTGVIQKVRAKIWPPATLYDGAADSVLLAARRAVQAEFPATADNVMVGDSITEQMNWPAAFPNASVANLGISHDTTAGVLARIDTILGSKARVVFLAIGINDLRSGVPLDVMLERHAEIRRRIASAGARIVVLSLVTRQLQVRDTVTSANKALAQQCKPAACAFVDLSPRLMENGMLRSAHTHDDVHLTAPAYRIWVDAIAAFVVTR